MLQLNLSRQLLSVVSHLSSFACWAQQVSDSANRNLGFRRDFNSDLVPFQARKTRAFFPIILRARTLAIFTFTTKKDKVILMFKSKNIQYNIITYNKVQLVSSFVITILYSIFLQVRTGCCVQNIAELSAYRSPLCRSCPGCSPL